MKVKQRGVLVHKSVYANAMTRLAVAWRGN